MHFNHTRPLYIDLDASKAHGFGAVAYYVKDANLISYSYPKRGDIEPIMFLSRMLFSAKTCYWLTELEVAGLV